MLSRGRASVLAFGIAITSLGAIPQASATYAASCMRLRAEYAIASRRGVLWNLARDGAEPFNQSLALCAIVDHEGVVIAMR